MRPDHFKSDIEEQDNSHEVYRKDVKRKSIGRRLLEKLKIKKEVLWKKQWIDIPYQKKWHNWQKDEISLKFS